MPADSAQDDGLSWFYALPMRDRVALLRDPKQPLSPRLLDRLAGQSGVVTQMRWAGSNAPWILSAAPLLLAIRDQLDDWWDDIAVHEQDYISQQRDGALDATYAEAVLAATGDTLRVELVSDVRTDGFRLPPMIRAFVEMRVRDQEAVDPPAAPYR